MPPNLWEMSLFTIVSGTVIAAVFAIVYGMFERNAAKPKYLEPQTGGVQAERASDERLASLWYIAGGMLTALVATALFIASAAIGSQILAVTCVFGGALGLAFVLFGLIR